MKELWNGTPSMRPLTLTSPRVPKNFTDWGQTTYTQPPGFGLRRNLALNETSRRPVFFFLVAAMTAILDIRAALSAALSSCHDRAPAFGLPAARCVASSSVGCVASAAVGRGASSAIGRVASAAVRS